MRFFACLKSINAWLLLTGISAAATLFAPVVVVFLLLLTSLFIPLALLLELFFLSAPTLFIVLLAGKLGIVARGGRRKGIAVGVLFALVLLAIPPAILNAGLGREVDALVSLDHDDMARPLFMKTIGIVENRERKKIGDPVLCDDFCRRMLLRGLSERVAVVQGLDAIPVSAEDLAANVFELRQETDCALGPFARYGDADAYRPPSASMYIGPSRELSKQFIRLEAAKGHCLTRSAGQIGDADTIIGYFQIGEKDDAKRNGFSLKSTARAIRLIVMQRLGGRLVETYRRTIVGFRPLAPLLIPTLAEMTEDSVKAGFWRTGKTRNAWGRMSDEAIWPEFLQKALNLNLGLERKTLALEAYGLIDNSLKSASPPSQSIQGLAQALLSDLLMTPGHAQRDEIALRILKDNRFRPPRYSSGAVNLAKLKGSMEVTVVANALFARLMALARDGDDLKQYEDAYAIGQAIEELPDDAVFVHKADLKWLASQKELRWPARRALVRLSVFGKDSVPLLLRVVQESIANPQTVPSGFDQQELPEGTPYAEAIRALCKIGPDASETTAALIAAFVHMQPAKWVAIRRLAAQTLLNFGLPADDVFVRLSTIDSKLPRKIVDSRAGRAGNKDECRVW